MPTLLDPAVATAAETHHEELRRQLVHHTQSLIDAVDTRISHDRAQQRLAAFLRTELLPHLDAEEILFYTTCDAGPLDLLTRAMQDEHRVMAALIRELERPATPMDAAVAAGALVVLFDVRVQQENQHLLPALAATGIDMSVLVDDTPEILGTSAVTGA